MDLDTEERELQPPKSFLEREYKFILLILIIILVGIAGLYYFLTRKVDNGLRNGFKKVETLSREVFAFHTLPVKNIILLVKNLKTRESEKVCDLPEEYYYWFREQRDFIGIYVSDNKFYLPSWSQKVFVGNTETLEIERTINLEPFKMQGTFFLGFVYYHNDEIWVANYSEPDGPEHPIYLLSKFVKGELKETDYCLDYKSNMMLKKLRSSSPCYFMCEDGIIPAPDSSPGTYDYDKRFGWLKSWYESDFKHSNSYHLEKAKNAGKIVWFQPGEKEGIQLTEGYNAFWGYDGNVYFVRNGSELWYYDMTREKVSRIYSPSSPDWAYRPKLSRDRTLLALPCKTWSSLNYMIFDLKNKECMELGNLHNFTWTDTQVK